VAPGRIDQAALGVICSGGTSSICGVASAASSSARVQLRQLLLHVAEMDSLGFNAIQVAAIRLTDLCAAIAMMTHGLNRIARGGRERIASVSGSGCAGGGAIA
jgi:hypothetical protein